jgi:hypothetical protein
MAQVDSKNTIAAPVDQTPTLIVPRRNFLIRALGFTIAGATVPVSIVTADDAKARIEHHQRELEKAWRDYYGPLANVRAMDRKSAPGALDPQPHRGQWHKMTSVFMICAGGGIASEALESFVGSSPAGKAVTS